MQRHLHAHTNTYRPYRMAYYKPTRHIEGFIHRILCHLCSSMFHSLRTASFGLTGSQNRFIGAMGESHYNVSGKWEQKRMERHYSSTGWRPRVCSIIHSQLPHHATVTVLTMSNSLFIKVALENLVLLLYVVDSYVGNKTFSLNNLKQKISSCIQP